jgi:hypothetical protein
MILDAETVTIELTAEKVEASDAKPSIFVNVVAKPTAGLDREFIGGWSVGPMSAKATNLAARLQAAVLAGAVYSQAEIRSDINGRTYISAFCNISGRRLNADLKRLGF